MEDFFLIWTCFVIEWLSENKIWVKHHYQYSFCKKIRSARNVLTNFQIFLIPNVDQWLCYVPKQLYHILQWYRPTTVNIYFSQIDHTWLHIQWYIQCCLLQPASKPTTLHECEDLFQRQDCLAYHDFAITDRSIKR